MKEKNKAMSTTSRPSGNTDSRHKTWGIVRGRGRLQKINKQKIKLLHVRCWGIAYATHCCYRVTFCR